MMLMEVMEQVSHYFFPKIFSCKRNFIDSYSFLSTAYGPIPSVFGENQIGQSSVMNGYVTKFAQENLTWEKSISKNVALERI